MKKLGAIENYIDTLTEEEIRYLQYQLAYDVENKRHNKLYPDAKREYYYELGFFGGRRIENIEKLEILGKEAATKLIKWCLQNILNYSSLIYM